METRDDFRARGNEYAAAFEVLARGCEIPPSLEVFEHELRERRSTSGGHSLSVKSCAEMIARSYTRVRGQD